VAVAVLLITNFVANAYEAEMNGKLTDSSGNPTSASVSIFFSFFFH
jgi:hypothetical protein